MTALPAQAAGVGRIALATPPGPDGRVHPVTLAAAALCGIEEIYAIGGAQAIFALAYGTETIAPVDVDRRPRQLLGPGSQAVGLRDGRDRLARRAVGADDHRRPRHRGRVGGARPLRAGRARRRRRCSSPRSRSTSSTRSPRRPSGSPSCVPASPARRRWRSSTSPTRADAVDLCNAFAPEHLRDLRGGRERPRRADHDRGLRLRRPLGRDRVRRLRGGLQPRAADRRLRPLHRAARPGRLPPADLRPSRSAPTAAAALAPSVDAIARAEGFPVHGESAMIRRS